jgi:hypothetical protein
VGDTGNWEFAAVVAAVVMGLGGLLIFTVISTIGSWRVFRLAAQASRESEAAAGAVQELARHMAAKQAAAPASSSAPAPSGELSDLLRQADALVGQQARLQDATRRLIEARVLSGDDAGQQLRELDSAVRRLEENLSRVAAAVANLGSRTI